jgi:hypothetical protein
VHKVIILRAKTYSVQTVQAYKYDIDNSMPALVFKHKAVAKGLTRENIKRLSHEDYGRMLNKDHCRNVINRRSKFDQVSYYLLVLFLFLNNILYLCML